MRFNNLFQSCSFIFIHLSFFRPKILLFQFNFLFKISCLEEKKSHLHIQKPTYRLTEPNCFSLYVHVGSMQENYKLQPQGLHNISLLTREYFMLKLFCTAKIGRTILVSFVLQKLVFLTKVVFNVKSKSSHSIFGMKVQVKCPLRL